jgi:hypothetical protein
LVELVQGELRALAASSMRHERSSHTLQPTALIVEAFLKIARASPEASNSRSHFMAVAVVATAMRRVLINHAEAHSADNRGPGRSRFPIDAGIAAPGSERVRIGEGAIFYLPIPSAKRCIVSIEGTVASDQIASRRYATGTPIESFTQASLASSACVRAIAEAARALLTLGLSDARTVVMTRAHGDGARIG